MKKNNASNSESKAKILRNLGKFALERINKLKKKARIQNIIAFLKKVIKNRGFRFGIMMLAIFFVNTKGVLALDEQEELIKIAIRTAQSLERLRKFNLLKKLFRSSQVVPIPEAITSHVNAIAPTLPPLILNHTQSKFPLFYPILTLGTIGVGAAYISYQYIMFDKLGRDY